MPQHGPYPPSSGGSGTSPSTLPITSLRGGSAGRTRIERVDGTWTAVADVETEYTVLTRDSTFAALKAALEHALTTAGSVFPPLENRQNSSLAFSVSIGGRFYFEQSGLTRQILNVWNADTAPFAWIVTPKQYGWVDGYSLSYEDVQPVSIATQDAMTVQKNYMNINSVPYDIARVQVKGAKPPADNTLRRIFFNYTAPAEAAPTIARIVQRRRR